MGEQTDDDVWASVNRIPLEASRSRLGVVAFPVVWETSPIPMSSARMKMMLGGEAAEAREQRQEARQESAMCFIEVCYTCSKSRDFTMNGRLGHLDLAKGSG